MGRKSLKNIRRQALVESFIKVINEKDLIHTTVRELTQVAGLSPGSLHHYFENKTALVVSTIEYLSSYYLKDLKLITNKCHNCSEKIKMLSHHYFNGEPLDMALFNAWAELLKYKRAHPEINDAFRFFFKEFKLQISAIIQEGINNGEFRKVNPNKLADLMIAGYEGSCAFWAIDHRLMPIGQFGGEVTQMFLRYLLR